MAEPNHVHYAQAERIIDADTYHLRIHLDFHVQIVVPVRLRGYNAPELGTPEGKAARDYVVNLLMPSMHPQRNPMLTIESYKDRQSFARWVCDIWMAGGSLLGDVLVEAGHARVIA